MKKTTALTHGNLRAVMRRICLRAGRYGAALAVAGAVAAVVAPASAYATAPTAGTVIAAQAYAEYQPAGFAMVERVESNTVRANVLAVESLVLTQPQTVNRPPNITATLPHMLANTGNVASSYTLALTANGPGCPATTFNLAGLKVVRDVNGNGTPDLSDPVIALGTAGALQLAPGEVASLLVQGVMPTANTGTACVVLSATTAAQAQSASNIDVVQLSNAAVVTMTKSASFPGVIQPDVSIVQFTISLNNVGNQDAVATAAVAPAATQVLVNGAPRTLMLVRDVIPSGLQYIAGSLASPAGGAVRLFRLPNDPPFSYRTGADDASVAEVAIGLPTGIVSNGSMAMRFSARVMSSAPDYVVNEAQAYYNDGVATAQAASNTAIVPVSMARIGLAKAASPLTAQFDSNGVPDGSGLTRFSLRVRNDGAAALHNVQITDVMEGADATKFGSYTSQGAPGAGQYTIVPGSVAIVSSIGVVAVANAGYTGQSSASGLLAPGLLLPAGSELTVRFDARINVKGRTGVMLNSAVASAAITEGGPAIVTDISTDGTEPDANRNGTASDDSTPTPVDTQMAALQLSKSVSVPRRLADGVFELDYTVHVTNIGSVPATYLRLVDNLNCAFDAEGSGGRVANWSLVGAPTAKNGLLTPANIFTGRATCDHATAAANAPPTAIPTAAVLSLTDGSRALAAGASEDVTFTVRVTLKPEFLGRGAVLVNKAWAGAYATNALGAGQLMQASSTTVDTLLIDPQGVVYNVATRAPIAGAVVSFKRMSCLSGGVTPLTADQIYGGDSGAYTYNADGSMSMTTAADGQYQFFFRSPPVQNLCDYALTVVPPDGFGLSVPSVSIPPQDGTFTSCGPVTASATAPADGADTRYFMRVRAGLDTSTGTVCEATHNHIPVEQGAISGLLLRKQGTKKEAEFGDFVDYALTATNQTSHALTGITFDDQLPVGFAYVRGTTRVNNTGAADPAGGAGPKLVFALPNLVLDKGKSVTVRYRLRIGVGAPISTDAINRAYATSGPARSNEASWRVRVTGGVFSDDAYAFGKVYLACPRSDGQFDPEAKKGVPGVRIFMEDGTSATTDADGKWSLYGLKPVTHALKIDATTLPRGAKLLVLDNRNSGAADSRFLDVKKGEYMRADFVISDCGGAAAGLTEEIEARRAALAKQQGEVGEDAAYKTRLTVESTVMTSGDTRALPASGSVSGMGSIASTLDTARPLIDLPVSSSGASTPLAAIGPQQSGAPVYNPLPKRPDGGADLLGPQPAPGIIDLETVLLKEENNTPGFIGLKNGDTVPSRTINVRVKGAAGANLRLSVNGDEIAERRVGKKATLPSKSLTAWEYIGVELKPGANELRLRIADDFGNVRTDEKISVTAPDKLGRIEIDLPDKARADLRTPATVRVRLVDANGVPVTARTQVTLETDRGRWLDTDLNPTEPGTQVFIEGGSADFTYIPPGEPGDVRVRASSGLLVKESRMSLLPEQRPMSGIGIVEGVIDLSGRGHPVTLGAQAAGSAFEAELGKIAGDGDARAGGLDCGHGAGVHDLRVGDGGDGAQRAGQLHDAHAEERGAGTGGELHRHADARRDRGHQVELRRHAGLDRHGFRQLYSAGGLMINEKERCSGA